MPDDTTGFKEIRGKPLFGGLTGTQELYSIAGLNTHTRRYAVFNNVSYRLIFSREVTFNLPMLRPSRVTRRTVFGSILLPCPAPITTNPTADPRIERDTLPHFWQEQLGIQLAPSGG